ncbi:hypothetical protein NEUTE2DRAFT_51776, partial [Neurospora tetrasperma FGSC 2509]
GLDISPELFENPYSTPKILHVGDYNRRFANPIALSFVVLCCAVLLTAVFLLSCSWSKCGRKMLFGLLQLPTLQFDAPHNTTSNPTIGALTPEYNAVIALYFKFWGFCVVYIFVFTRKTNTVLALPYSLSKLNLAGVYWRVDEGKFEVAGRLQKDRFDDYVNAPSLSVPTFLSWLGTRCPAVLCSSSSHVFHYEMRITVSLPVGDLSHFWPRTDVMANEWDSIRGEPIYENNGDWRAVEKYIIHVQWKTFSH